ncbi:SUMF1/EgtB/PvdO family nonheme iron enzyme [bacterium]|nr:SUMF1/EgtB/PvdO family nonheme iron enzyme [candidate division CSSED10-310 bacterium]
MKSLSGLVLSRVLLFIGMSFLAVPHAVCQTPTPECLNTGDVNFSGTITASDAQLAFLITLGTVIPTYEEACASDCNGSGSVTAADAQAIFLTVLGSGTCVDPIPPTPTNTPVASPVPVSVGLMIPIDAGTFSQGSPPAEACRGSNETIFSHTLTRDFEVMETSITRRMWADLLAVQSTLPADPSNTTWSPTLDHPAQRTSWFHSVLFANLLSLQNGYTRCYYKDAAYTIPVDHTNYSSGTFTCNFDADGYRLPTEGEAEYYIRAGTSTPFSCSVPGYSEATCYSCTLGDLPELEQVCWFCAQSGYAVSMVAGTLNPNPWMLKDVHGNVWNWCWDYFDIYPTAPQTDYTGPASGTQRICRGGSLAYEASGCRSARRSYYPAHSLLHDNGFRLVRTLN